jgi:hypothetical protein
LHNPEKVSFCVGTISVVSNPRDDRLGYNNAPSCADYPLCELIDRGNVDGINCRFVSHALPDRSVNAGLAAIISADKPVVNWSFPFVDALAKDALIKHRCSRRIVRGDFKMDNFRHSFSIKVDK